MPLKEKLLLLLACCTISCMAFVEVSAQAWLCGSNFIPSTAINQLEMWQKETFDPATIDRELGYAENIGMSCMRVFLHHAAWQEDNKGFRQRVNDYLVIADKHHIKTIFVFFDDCWNDNYHTGTQPEPITGKHNSGWLKDPGNRIDSLPLMVDTLEQYVKDILREFGGDKRILAWDLYNEPGQFDRFNKSYSLLANLFIWARTINPSQPITVGFYDSDKRLDSINQLSLSKSDVISYHCYGDSLTHQELIDSLKRFGKPLICTEYMARKRGSTFQNILPMLKKENIAAINWGLVAGKTNTIFAWDELSPEGNEPKLWFHDIFRRDGTPFNKIETALIQQMTGEGK
jgi:hypothetical protein